MSDDADDTLPWHIRDLCLQGLYNIRDKNYGPVTGTENTGEAMAEIAVKGKKYIIMVRPARDDE